MEFFTDEYFQIGQAHLGGGKPCQDYALSEVYKGTALAIVSDGCSSGWKTDIGSRLVCLNAISAVKKLLAGNKELNSEQGVREGIITRNIILSEAQNILELDIMDMLATSIFAGVSVEGGIVVVEGDGVVAIKYRNGDIVAHNFEWNQNMPYYPIYKNGLLQQFIEAQGNDLEQRQLQETLCLINSDGTIRSQEKILHTLSDGIDGIGIELLKDMLSDIEFVAVFSDGITQIEKMPWAEAVREMLNFKGVKGVFVKRRIASVLRSIGKVGQRPIDDISCAIIRIGPEEEFNDNAE